jgi:hypothetical protein
MTEFNFTVCGIPCIIRITYWEPYRAATLRADPGDSHPEEGGCGDWEILDRKGRPAIWLTRKLTGQELAKLEHAIFEHMETQHDDR